MRFNLLRTGFIALALALAMPMPTWSQSTPQITILLADPQLGVVGVDQSGGNTLFFEARTPAGSTLSARLVDALGRTIAISGHSMDSLWLPNADFNAADATQSLSLAAGLPDALAKVLNRNVFPNEYTAISNLSLSAAGITPSTAPAVIDSATAKLATPSQTTLDAAASFDASAATGLTSTRDSSGNLSATFGGTAMQTFVENFPNAQNDDGTVGITEVSARLVSSTGRSLIQQLGGDRLPDTWDDLTSDSIPTGDTLQPFIEAGNAIRGASLMTRSSTIATADETAALGQVTAALRDNGLLPQPASLAHNSASLANASTSACGIGLNYVGLWAKALAKVAQHSGTYVFHWFWNGSRWVPDYGILFCNHGTCPYKSPMTLRCQYYSPPIRCHYRNPPIHVVPQGEPGPGQFHSCRTGYGLTSFFNHNCNDDSWTQIRAIKGEAQSDQNYRCHDWKPDPRAPGCNQ